MNSMKKIMFIITVVAVFTFGAFSFLELFIMKNPKPIMMFAWLAATLRDQFPGYKDNHKLTLLEYHFITCAIVTVIAFPVAMFTGNLIIPAVMAGLGTLLTTFMVGIYNVYAGGVK